MCSLSFLIISPTPAALDTQRVRGSSTRTVCWFCWPRRLPCLARAILPGEKDRKTALTQHHMTGPLLRPEKHVEALFGEAFNPWNCTQVLASSRNLGQCALSLAHSIPCLEFPVQTIFFLFCKVQGWLADGDRHTKSPWQQQHQIAHGNLRFHKLRRRASLALPTAFWDLLNPCHLCGHARARTVTQSVPKYAFGLWRLYWQHFFVDHFICACGSPQVPVRLAPTGLTLQMRPANPL
mmetsp:Transcript_6621/g.9444  ORF Transcript_6621/g.9444 Transcript_6621/m.9444 type:complete len:237 (-) Transcript_6621:65-775(-)